MRRLLLLSDVEALGSFMSSPLGPVIIVCTVACEAILPIGYGVYLGYILGGSKYLLINGFIVSKHSL